MDYLRYLWKYFLARFRLSKAAVCEMSLWLGPYDFHDYPDDIHGWPCHFVYLTCKRCGKKFLM